MKILCFLRSIREDEVCTKDTRSDNTVPIIFGQIRVYCVRIFNRKAFFQSFRVCNLNDCAFMKILLSFSFTLIYYIFIFSGPRLIKVWSFQNK